ncbi:MAG TPA: SCO family protein [Acidimicrobiales bacterium]|jgi:cytochrome oxidase Cu insertion factor (SCO1/SenC/PrrC family)|nr:SCO family protein [Acidimicrobiales bacterium]
MSGPVETEGGAPVAGLGGGDPVGAAPAPSELDRAAALEQGSPGIPSRFIWWVLGAVLVLSLGGFVGERVISAVGLNASSVTTTSAPNPVRVSPRETPAPPASDRTLDAPLASFMGLSAPRPRAATPFSATDQNGQPVSLSSQPARVVVLTFFNAPCNDICPVLATEITEADAFLGPRAADVEFITVNTDPAALATAAESPAVSGTALGTLPNWQMVTGPLDALNPLWKAYGVSISVDPKTGAVVHNDVMDFIDPQGIMRYRAMPYADESSLGTFALGAASEARWAQGIATYAGRLVGQ